MTSSTTEVAVTLIRNSMNQLLLVYNEKWGSFTIPMTKLRKPRDDSPESAREAEEWLDAAARNVVECLGRPALPIPAVKTPVPEARLSGREQVTKGYLFHVFEERYRDSGAAPDRVAAKTPHVWATPQQILKREIRPLSKTAHDLVAYDEIIKFLSDTKI